MRPLHRLYFSLAMLALVACGSSEPVTEADKALFLRVADLAEFGVRYANPEAGETFSKAKQADGSYELTYKFESSGEQRPLYLYSTVNVGRKPSDAGMAESADKVGLLVAFRKNGVEEREVGGVRTGKLVLLMKGDVPVGNVFTLREGDRSQLLVLSGMYVKDAAIWQKLMGPKLDLLARYSAAKS